MLVPHSWSSEFTTPAVSSACPLSTDAERNMASIDASPSSRLAAVAELEDAEKLARTCLLVWWACTIESGAETSAARVEFVFKHACRFRRLLLQVCGCTLEKLLMVSLWPFWIAWQGGASESVLLRRFVCACAAHLSHVHVSVASRATVHSWHLVATRSARHPSWQCIGMLRGILRGTKPTLCLEAQRERLLHQFVASRLQRADWH